MSIMNTISLATMTDAEIGAIVRAGMEAAVAEVVPASRTKAQKKAKKDRKAEKVAMEEARVVRQGSTPLAEIVVGTTLTVPALDLSEVTSLDETMPGTMRSPYNKARYRLEQSPALDKDTTFAQLAVEHLRLAAIVGAL